MYTVYLIAFIAILSTNAVLADTEKIARLFHKCYMDKNGYAIYIPNNVDYKPPRNDGYMMNLRVSIWTNRTSPEVRKAVKGFRRKRTVCTNVGSLGVFQTGKGIASDKVEIIPVSIEECEEARKNLPRNHVSLLKADKKGRLFTTNITLNIPLSWHLLKRESCSESENFVAQRGKSRQLHNLRHSHDFLTRLR